MAKNNHSFRSSSVQPISNDPDSFTSDSNIFKDRNINNNERNISTYSLNQNQRLPERKNSLLSTQSYNYRANEFNNSYLAPNSTNSFNNQNYQNYLSYANSDSISFETNNIKQPKIIINSSKKTFIYIFERKNKIHFLLDYLPTNDHHNSFTSQQIDSLRRQNFIQFYNNQNRNSLNHLSLASPKNQLETTSLNSFNNSFNETSSLLSLNVGFNNDLSSTETSSDKQGNLLNPQIAENYLILDRLNQKQRQKQQLKTKKDQHKQQLNELKQKQQNLEQKLNESRNRITDSEVFNSKLASHYSLSSNNLNEIHHLNEPFMNINNKISKNYPTTDKFNTLNKTIRTEGKLETLQKSNSILSDMSYQNQFNKYNLNNFSSRNSFNFQNSSTQNFNQKNIVSFFFKSCFVSKPLKNLSK